MSWKNKIPQRNLSLFFFFDVPQPSTPWIYDFVKQWEKETKRGSDKNVVTTSPSNLLSVIRSQIESLPSFLHLSVNMRSIKPHRAHSDPSRQQTFPPFPLTLALLLDWSSGNAHTLKILIIVLSSRITCGEYRFVNLSLRGLFAWHIRFHCLMFHHWLKPLFFSIGPVLLSDEVSVMCCRALILKKID